MTKEITTTPLGDIRPSEEEKLREVARLMLDALEVARDYPEDTWSLISVEKWFVQIDGAIAKAKEIL